MGCKGDQSQSDDEQEQPTARSFTQHSQHVSPPPYPGRTAKGGALRPDRCTTSVVQPHTGGGWNGIYASALNSTGRAYSSAYGEVCHTRSTSRPTKFTQLPTAQKNEPRY